MAVLVLSFRSLRVDLGDGLAGGLLVDDGRSVRVGGDEGLAGEVVHRPGKSPSGLMDARQRVVGEERVGATAELAVVGDVARGLLFRHRRDRVAERDALVEGGEAAETEP